MTQPDRQDLERQLQILAERVSRLEQRIGLEALTPAPPGITGPEPREAAPAILPPALSVLPLFGRALLGLAGAYLLRALSESGTLPVRVGVALGIVYALFWLAWAARRGIGAVEALLNSSTAALIVAPLLWEATLRFHSVSNYSAAAVLMVFAISGLAVSWRAELSVVARVATVAGLATASALLMATHDVMPFTFVLLGISAVAEMAAYLDHPLGERWLMALAADGAVWLATWLITNERGLPEAYAPIAQGSVLLAHFLLAAIYLGSAILRTLLRGFSFTTFETAQCALAFAIAVGGGLRLSHAANSIGTLALACSFGCYVVSFLLLDRGGKHSRNFYTYSTFAILLALAGTRILAGGTEWMAWSALAVACLWAGERFGRLTLQVHGTAYLLLALASSGAFSAAAALLLGSAAWPDESGAKVVAELVAAAVCYFLAVSYSGGRGEWTSQAPRLAVAAALVWVAAGVIAGGLTAGYHGIFGSGATHAYCATLRTGVLAAAALLGAWAGAHRPTSGLAPFTYPLMALGAYRLLALDLRQERTAAMVLSLLIYGTALMALPRVNRVRAARAE